VDCESLEGNQGSECAPSASLGATFGHGDTSLWGVLESRSKRKTRFWVKLSSQRGTNHRIVSWYRNVLIRAINSMATNTSMPLIQSRRSLCWLFPTLR
jgi:hypothetical protein